jgi:hypothetical protein
MPAKPEGLIIIQAASVSGVPMPHDILQGELLRIAKKYGDEFPQGFLFDITLNVPIPAPVPKAEPKVEKSNYILKDDILNLKIALGNAQSVEDFLKVLG